MNFLAKTYQLLALTINFIAGGLLLISAYSYLIPPDRFSLPYFFTLAFPVFFFIEILLLLQIFIRPRKYVLLPIAFLLLSFQAVQNYFPTHFKGKDNKMGKISLLSYNIRSFVQSKPTDNGKSNTVLDLLRNSGADIICLQEYNTVPSGSNRQLSQKMVEKVLSDYPYHHVFKPTPWNSGIACFSKYPFKNIEPIPFDRSQNGACLYQSTSTENLSRSSTATWSRTISNRKTANCTNKSQKILPNQPIFCRKPKAGYWENSNVQGRNGPNKPASYVKSPTALPELSLSAGTSTIRRNPMHTERSATTFPMHMFLRDSARVSHTMNRDSGFVSTTYSTTTYCVPSTAVSFVRNTPTTTRSGPPCNGIQKMISENFP